mgnify:CR=1 FL=1
MKHSTHNSTQMPTTSPEKIVMYLQTQSFAGNCESLYEKTLIGKL